MIVSNNPLNYEMVNDALKSFSSFMVRKQNSVCMHDSKKESLMDSLDSNDVTRLLQLPIINYRYHGDLNLNWILYMFPSRRNII